jgi:hypothetical protein
MGLCVSTQVMPTPAKQLLTQCNSGEHNRLKQLFIHTDTQTMLVAVDHLQPAWQQTVFVLLALSVMKTSLAGFSVTAAQTIGTLQSTLASSAVSEAT